jgi:hypothetical protein
MNPSRHCIEIAASENYDDPREKTPAIASAYCDAVAHLANLKGLRITKGEGQDPVPALF